MSRLSWLRGFPGEALGSSSCPAVMQVPQKPPSRPLNFSLLCPKVDLTVNLSHIKEWSSTVRREERLLFKVAAFPVQCPKDLSAAQPPSRAASTGGCHAWASFSCHRLHLGPASREEAEPFTQQVLAREAKNHRNPRDTKRREQ